MIYAAVLKDMTDVAFRREDVLNAVLKKYPEYNVSSFNRHFSRMLSKDLIENVGRNLYIATSPDIAKRTYLYEQTSAQFSDVSAFLASEFPLADFLVWETVQMNEFFGHQTAQNIIVVSAEKMLAETIFERMKERSRHILLSPKPDDINRYAENGSVIIEKLSSRYPKNRTDKHGYSIEKLIVDMFAEKTVRSFFSKGEYPAALENIFRKYKVNENRMFNYAKMRRVDDAIRHMIENDTDVDLYTDGELIF
jgi:hypothetical protein